MKNFKNKWALGIALIISFIVVIFACFKIKEYLILKDAFVFSKDNIVSVWKVKKDENTYDYNYKLENNEVDALSDILTSSKLKKATINESPPNTLGSITILLDGKLIKSDGEEYVGYERGITLTPIDKGSVYVLLEINKLINDNNSNMENVMQKFYIIDSEKLVEVINSNI